MTSACIKTPLLYSVCTYIGGWVKHSNILPLVSNVIRDPGRGSSSGGPPPRAQQPPGSSGVGTRIPDPGIRFRCLGNPAPLTFAIAPTLFDRSVVVFVVVGLDGGAHVMELAVVVVVHLGRLLLLLHAARVVVYTHLDSLLLSRPLARSLSSSPSFPFPPFAGKLFLLHAPGTHSSTQALKHQWHHDNTIVARGRTRKTTQNKINAS